MVESYLSEPNAKYMLGAGAEYSLGDVMFTCMLTRLGIDAGFFNEYVLTKPNIAKYW